jgi:hypothetical protein
VPIIIETNGHGRPERIAGGHCIEGACSASLHMSTCQAPNRAKETALEAVICLYGAYALATCSDVCFPSLGLCICSILEWPLSPEVANCSRARHC